MQVIFISILIAVWFSGVANGQNTTSTCLLCDRVNTTDECTGPVSCAVDEICYMDEIITNELTVVYNGGCRSAVVCYNGSGGQNLNLKAGDLIACSRCCDLDIIHGVNCNARLCGIKSPLPTTTVSPSRLTCTHCHRVSSLEECTGSIACGPDEECYMDQLITDRLTLVYEGGCRRKDVCQSSSSVSHSFGKRSDLDSELVACSRCCDIPALSGQLNCNERLCGIRFSCELISNCIRCSGNYGEHCDQCAPGYHPVDANTTCLDTLSNYDVICIPKVKDHCYIIFKTLLSWADAKAVCEKRNGQLFVPQSMGEELFVENYLSALKGEQLKDPDTFSQNMVREIFVTYQVSHIMHYSHSVFWIGGKREAGQESWQSNKDSNVDRLVSSPNFNMNSTSCFAMDGQANFMWNNFRCDTPSFFICKEKYARQTRVVPDCKLVVSCSGALQISTLKCMQCHRASSVDDCTGSIQCGTDEECYMEQLITDQLTIVYEAGCRFKDVCQQSGRRSIMVPVSKRGDLIACSRCCDIQALAGELECNAKLCGIKYSCPLVSNCIRCSGNYGEHCDQCAPGYHPVDANTTCLDTLSNYDVICIPKVKDHCYIIFKTLLSWIDAKAVCEKRNGQLFVPQSIGEELFVENYLSALKDIMHYSHSVFWIGGKRDAGQDSWQSNKDSNVDRLVSSPNFSMNSTSCFAMDGQSKFMWNNFRCDTPSYFICKEKTPFHPTQQPPMIG